MQLRSKMKSSNPKSDIIKVNYIKWIEKMDHFIKNGIKYKYLNNRRVSNWTMRMRRRKKKGLRVKKMVYGLNIMKPTIERRIYTVRKI